MPTNEYLDDERVKLWNECKAIRTELEESVKKLSQTYTGIVDTLNAKEKSLQESIAAVRKIADAKTPEDVQTAKRAAAETVKIKSDLQALLSESESVKAQVQTARKAFQSITNRDGQSAAKLQEIEVNRKSIADAMPRINEMINGLDENKRKMSECVDQIGGMRNTASAHAQEIQDLKTKASTDFSEFSAFAAKIKELRDELSATKSEYDEWIKATKEESEKASSSRIEEFGKFMAECGKRAEDLTGQIDALLPGATSAALATSFEKRKKEVEKTKWWWAALLILAAVGIVAFGCWSLFRSTVCQNALQLPIRLIIIAGLVIIEEFARRNYSIATKLAEAYAYKEAIAKSYLGFKKELAEINMPAQPTTDETPSVSVLASAFIDKIKDEPGKSVFDKQKRAFGLYQVLSQMTQANTAETTQETTEGTVKSILSAFSAMAKISWPLVTLVSVLAVCACVIVYIIFK